MNHSSSTKPCYCCSGQLYTNCCQPLLCGQATAKSPLELMRSRYAAFATNNTDYINKTMTNEAAQQTSTDAENIQPIWKRLEILQAPAANGCSGEVEFIAHCQLGNKQQQIHEHSLFEKIDNEWFYTGAKSHRINTIKPQRNSHCPCGSGLKYKKCCIHKH